MSQNHKRRHMRLRHSAKISVNISADDPMVFEMRDFSESGLYLCCSEDLFNIGDILEVKTLEFEDAPRQQARVVRIEPGQGFAVEFINS